jgi:anti-anti-sigma factor
VKGAAVEVFSVTVDAHNVFVSGELDLMTTSFIDAAFADLLGDVVVDCTDLKFIDSAGFYCLDRGYNAAVRRQASFEVAGFSRFQQRVARMLSAPYVAGSGEAA